MSDTEKLRRHEQLMLRMGDRNGADFMLAEQVGLVSPEEIFEATLSCTGCSEVEACETHLDSGAKGIPSYCRNEGLIRRLAGDFGDLGLADH
jgi:hypothetical protein